MALHDDRAIPLLAQTLWQADRSADTVSGYPVNGTAEEQAKAVAQADTVVAVLKLRVSGGETAGEGA
jgi:xanthine/CO dehydrogenase XdhC/CoxF family maturation factor